MTDSTTAAGQEPNADAAQDATSGSGQDSQPTGFDALPPETQAEIRKLRKENAGYRKRVDEFEAANQTASEKREAALKAAEERATAAETRLRGMTAKAAVTDAASKSGSISASAVYALIRDDLEFGDDGEPTNVAALIAQAKKDEPALFRAANGSADGGKGSGPATNAGSFNDVIRELARTAT